MAVGRKKGEHKQADSEVERLVREISSQKQRIHDLEQAESERDTKIEELQKSLQENLIRYNELADHSRSIILEWDTEGNIIFLNKWGLELFGFTMEELIGRNVVGTIVPPIDTSGKNLVEKMEVVEKKPDEFYSSENENIKKNGESVWISWTNKGILDEDGKLIKTLSIGIDRTMQRQQEVALAQYSAELETKVEERTKDLQETVTARTRELQELKRAEEKLKESELRFRSTFEQAAVGIAHVATDGRWLRVNQKLCDIVGYSREELLQRTFQDITHPGDLDADLELVRKLLAGQLETYTMEKRYIRKDRSLVWINLTVSLVRKRAGETDYFISVVEDITDRKKTEQALGDSEAKFKTLFMIGPDASYVATAEGGLMFEVSQNLEVLFGYTRDEMIGHTSKELGLWVNYADRLQMVEDLKKQGYSSVETVGRKKSGETFNCIVSMKTLLLDNIQCIIGTVRDITALVQNQEEKGKMLRFEMLLSDLSARFVNVPTDQIDNEISEAQHLICDFLDIDLSSIYELSPEIMSQLQLTHLYKRVEIPPVSDEFIAQIHFPWCEQQLSSGKEVVVNSLKELPDAAKIDCVSWHHYGIKSSLMFPLLTRGEQIVGTLSFDMVREERPWTNDLMNRLKMVAQVFANALSHKYSEEAIRKSEIRFRSTFEQAAVGIAHVGIDGRWLRVNQKLCDIVGYSREELLQGSFQDITYHESLDSDIESLNKLVDGQIENYTKEKRYIRKDGSLVWANITVALARKASGDPDYLISVIEDISERKRAEENLIKSYESLKKTLDDAINTMVKIVEMRDPYTAGHQQRVAKLAKAISEEMKLEPEKVEQLNMAAVIHDIGKIQIPAEILSKPGKLDKLEREIIKTHSQKGYEIVHNMDFHPTVAQVILQHHERIDGSGYPNGSTGKDIIIEAKILSVADVVEAMMSHRPYRPAIGIDKALDEISSNKGKLYDPEVVDACLRLFNEKGFKLDPD